MKFGSWTYNGAQVDLRHLDQVPGSNIVAIGVDLKEFYPSVEWDILEIPAGRNEEYYPEFSEPFSGWSNAKSKSQFSLYFPQKSNLFCRHHIQVYNASKNIILHG